MLEQNHWNCGKFRCEVAYDLRGSGWPSGRKLIVKTKWLMPSEWGSLLNNGPKLGAGQQNSRLKKFSVEGYIH